MARCYQALWLAVAGSMLILSSLAPAGGQVFRSRLGFSAAVHLDDADNAARAHLERVKAFLAEQQWDEAIETLRRVMDDGADQVIRVESMPVGLEGQLPHYERYVSVRDYCHLLLCTLPGEHQQALRRYRRRVDPLAERWYRAGIADGDADRLRHVVDLLFASSRGDDALYALGEIELERGDYGAARLHWERISPLLRTAGGLPAWLALGGPDDGKGPPPAAERRGPPTWLAYPDTDLDLADVRARLVLVSIMEGSPARAALELEALGRLSPDARGTMGGRQVNYVQMLTALLAQSKTWPAVSGPTGWTTFAGSPTRTKTLPGGVDIGGRPLWTIKLSQPVTEDKRRQVRFGWGRWPVAEDRNRPLSYHPLVVGDLVLVNDETRIRALNLYTGRPPWPGAEGSSDADRGVIYPANAESVPVRRRGRDRLGVPRFTMTVHRGNLYARMGSPVTAGPNTEWQPRGEGELIGLDLKAEGKLFLQIKPGDKQWAFEGPPLVDGTNLYVAMRRSEVQPQAHVACFDAQTGRLRWRRRICSAETLGQGRVFELTHNLLTLHGGTIYLNTNLGAVAALSADDGSIRWITAYPRATAGGEGPPRSMLHFARDLNPCVYYKGTLLVAPADCESIFALDAATGKMIWQSRLPEDAVHLLGVGGGNLIASGNYLYWLDVRSGKLVDCFPARKKIAPGHSGGSPTGFGRGILAGGRIYWPTREAIHVFDQQAAVPIRQPIVLTHRGPVMPERQPGLGPDGRPELTGERPKRRPELTGGNLVVAKGHLLIATAERLFAFDAFGPPPRAVPPPVGNESAKADLPLPARRDDPAAVQVEGQPSQQNR